MAIPKPDIAAKAKAHDEEALEYVRERVTPYLVMLLNRAQAKLEQRITCSIDFGHPFLFVEGDTTPPSFHHDLVIPESELGSKFPELLELIDVAEQTYEELHVCPGDATGHIEPTVQPGPPKQFNRGMGYYLRVVDSAGNRGQWEFSFRPGEPHAKPGDDYGEGPWHTKYGAEEFQANEAVLTTEVVYADEEGNIVPQSAEHIEFRHGREYYRGAEHPDCLYVAPISAPINPRTGQRKDAEWECYFKNYNFRG